MNIDEHRAVLVSSCRVCGRKLGKVSFSCQRLSEKLFTLWGISVGEDEENVHPLYFCHACRCVVRRYCDKPSFTSIQQPVSWSKHPRIGPCVVCTRVTESRKGGRPKKPGFRGRNPPKANEGPAITCTSVPTPARVPLTPLALPSVPSPTQTPAANQISRACVIASIINAPLSQPLDSNENDLLLSLFQRGKQASTNKDIQTVQLKTGGPVSVKKWNL